MSSTVTRDAEGTVTGNTYDKYGSSNPVVKKLMAGFERTLDELWAKASPRSVLDVGCGEGVLTHKWAKRLRDGRVVGIDLEDPAIQAEWAKRPAPNLGLLPRRQVGGQLMEAQVTGRQGVDQLGTFITRRHDLDFEDGIAVVHSFNPLACARRIYFLSSSNLLIVSGRRHRRTRPAGLRAGHLHRAGGGTLIRVARRPK